ncbi:phosphoribosyltransferase family protein [Blastococcus brunescens]|uniref:adenine phosphoribosyltransferase n=1 Tax=Blastococcus brunescens TaxID=1564165 RepID=A0ABZ1B7U2_9ACTN|nr:phosphoribosyltransferase family protein [Blastococcus sp. BMG 8361]WRL66186.1 phosphoribosyltransferase family protein [Blastococcus sp. BMG 8361]
MAESSARDFDVVVGVEARGFLLAAAVAFDRGVGVVPVRKAGKLPRDRVAADYVLEYGTATLELHADSIRRGARVLVVDDVLATGGRWAPPSSWSSGSAAWWPPSPWSWS